MTQHPLKVLLWQLPAALFIAILLAEIYAAVDRIIPGPGWLAAASVNSLLAVVVWLWVMPGTMRRISLVDVLPSAAVITGVLLAATTTRFLLPEATQISVGYEQFYYVIWIPIVEEVLFRGGFGRFFAGRSSRFAAAYVSALLFAFVHSAPTLEHLIAGQVGIPLGPFVLALSCETLLIYGRTIWCVIGLHAACNASIALFAFVDARWLEWLGALYG